MSNLEGKPFTPDEQKDLISGTSFIHDEALLRWGLETGMRVGDVSTVEIGNVDLETGRVQAWDEKKDQWNKSIQISGSLCRLLRSYLQTRKWVKPKDKRLFPISPKTMNRKLKKWAWETQVRDPKETHWHDLRSTYIMNCARDKVDVKIPAEQTGDTIETLLRWYDKPLPEDKRRVADEMASKFE